MLKLISNLIAFILTKTVFRFKVKQLHSMIDKDKEKEVIKAARKLKTAVDKWNKDLEKPAIRKMYKKLGINPDDMKMNNL